MSKNNSTKNSAAKNSTGAFAVNWDIEKYRDEHECEEHWQLRKAFMEKWKKNFPEERLICLARVYTNIEFMGCRYPAPVMQQIAQLSFEVGQRYKDKKKTKLQRTFVSASTAAEDRARGIKRVGGEIVTDDKPKSTRIAFVAQGEIPAPEDENVSDEEVLQNNLHHSQTATAQLRKWLEVQQTAIALIQEPWIRAGRIQVLQSWGDISAARLLIQRGYTEVVVVVTSAYIPDAEESPPHDLAQLFCESTGLEVVIGADVNAHHPLWGMDTQNARGHKNQASDAETEIRSNTIKTEDQDTSASEKKNSDYADDYIKEMANIKCLDVRLFRDDMFVSSFGRMVLLIRPWARKMWNIQTSCQVCGVSLTNGYENRVYSLCINKILLAEATGETKVEAKNAVEIIAWEKLLREVVSVLIKEQFIAQGDARISRSDVSGKKRDDMFGTPVETTVAMKMMKMMGWQGGGLGVDAQGISEPIKPNLQMVNRAGLGSFRDIRLVRRAAQTLMQRFIATDTFDLDLVFTSDFTKEERAALHQVAQKSGLASRSYGEGDERFLVVKKKLNPFSLVRAIIEKGGTTPKYQVFIPKALARDNSS